MDTESALLRVGFNTSVRTALQALTADPELRPARLVARHRSRIDVHDGSQTLTATITPGLLQRLEQAEQEPVVGDWCLLRTQAGDPLLEALLPRQNLLQRARSYGGRQSLAANVDTALLLMGLDGNYNPKRLERFLLLVRGADVRPLILLTKADTCDNVVEHQREIEQLAGNDTTVLVGDARDAQLLQTLSPWLGLGQTLVLLGSSGVGKSTLANTLCGIARQRTGSVSEAEDRGRHTTVARQLLLLPSGACLIDTPGLRELQLAGEESVADDAFSDIAALATQCRFGNCSHLHEPGCAVIAATAPSRLAHYHKLAAELAHTQALRTAVRQQKNNGKTKTSSARKPRNSPDKHR